MQIEVLLNGKNTKIIHDFLSAFSGSLYIFQHLGLLPWESMACLAGAEVNRMPCLATLQALATLHLRQPVDGAASCPSHGVPCLRPDKVVAVVNPEDNLSHTNSTLVPHFSR